MWTAVDDYVTNLLVKPDAALTAVLAASTAAGLPSINVAPPQGKFLGLLASACGARAILEIGTLGGYSTVWLARGLAPGGTLMTLEADGKHATVARANIDRAGLSGVVEVVLGPAQASLERLVADGHSPFDLIFIDADKVSYADYFSWSLKLSRRGTVIVADNIVRDGAVIDQASRDTAVQGVRRFNEAVAAEPRVSATVLQTVGAKGYDGFLLAVYIA